MDSEWVGAYGMVAESVDRDSGYGLSSYQEEAGPSVGEFLGGSIHQREWTPSKALEKSLSMRAVAEYEEKYIN